MICPDVKPARRTERRRALRFAGPLLLLCGFCFPAWSQDKAADVFDDEPEQPKPKKELKSSDSELADPVKDRDSIGFNQEQVAAQMSELEDRMFRLSEALKTLEPENASRLRLALKFSREELILHQMKQTQQLLAKAALDKAEPEVRQLLAKLEHLRELLLAQDLDFQMKLARLRQMRETMDQLDRIIKEERRELAVSEEAAADQEKTQSLADAKSKLAALLQKQRNVLRDTQPLAGQSNPASEKMIEIAGRERAVRAGASELAQQPLFAHRRADYLKRAEVPLADAATHLESNAPTEAIASATRAQQLMQRELDLLDADEAALKQKLSPASFARSEQDQARNRVAAMSLAATASRLGSAGVDLQKSLIRASAAMQNAETDLAQTEANLAAQDQDEALKHLVKSQSDLAAEVEKLLDELRSELRRRLIAEIGEMQEIQKAIRETTEDQAPRVAQQSRTAQAVVVSLAKKEAELAEKLEQLTLLVEETEFGIALPTALRVLGRQMRQVEGRLGQAQANAQTIALERRVEEDLQGLLEAMRRLPSSSPPPPGAPLPSQPGPRLRELNRLVAELKMIRMLQTRLNDDTTGTDAGRAKSTAVLTPALRREILGLSERQEEIQTSLAKIADRVEPPERSAFESFDRVQERLGPKLRIE